MTRPAKLGTAMAKEFIEERDGSFYLLGSRVPLAHVVREFQLGESPEAIRAHFPALTLEQVYGAIAFYLGHQEHASRDAADREREEDEFAKIHSLPPELKRKLEHARTHLLPRR